MTSFSIRQTTFASLLLSWPTYVSAQTLTASTSNVCQGLTSQFSSSSFLPPSPAYSVMSEMNWSQTAWDTPTCIFRPGSTAELQTAIPMLVQNNVSFAIRAGGHSPSPGAANIGVGVLIDMSAFNDVEYYPVEQVAVVGSGQRWDTVYSKLDPYQVTVVGGRVLDVGVGGLTLGGGLSYLSDLYGMVCDNVVNFEIVLADGSVVNANATSNPDLMWALKGGTNNFGIVTRFTMSTYPIYNVWGGVKSYTINDLPAIFNAVLEYQTNPIKDPYANLFIQGFPTTNSSFGVNINMVYLKPVESPAAFAPFYSIPTTADSTHLRTFSDFLGGQALFDIPRIDWRATSFEPDAALYSDVLSLMTTSQYVQTVKSVTAGSLAFGFQPISPGLVQGGIDRGGNPMGHSLLPQTWFVIDTLWWSPNDDQTVHNSVHSLLNDIETSSTAKNKYLSYQFMNDASWDQSVIAHYGAANVQKMRDVQAKFDPNLVFQRLVPGGFKIPSVSATV